jgi:hypothetical protein
MTWQEFKQRIDTYLQQNQLPETIEVDYIDISTDQVSSLEINCADEQLKVYGSSWT